VLRRPIEITRVTVDHLVREPSSWNPNRNGVMKAYRFRSEGRMGTGGGWIEVIRSAVFWGGGMLWFDSVTGRNNEARFAIYRAV
jgi:hypothetical protein